MILVVKYDLFLLCYRTDQAGTFLLSGSSDDHLFIMDARVSKKLNVLGYTGDADI